MVWYLYLSEPPLSHLLTACRDTHSSSANCSWVSPVWRRTAASCWPNDIPFLLVSCDLSIAVPGQKSIILKLRRRFFPVFLRNLRFTSPIIADTRRKSHPKNQVAPRPNLRYTLCMGGRPCPPIVIRKHSLRFRRGRCTPRVLASLRGHRPLHTVYRRRARYSLSFRASAHTGVGIRSPRPQARNTPS